MLETDKLKKIAKVMIVGLPNSGKSQIFYKMTGEYTLISNHQYTTMEAKKTICKIHGVDYEIIDTPGLHGLYVYSEEDLLVRNMIFKENPDIMIQCIDANNFRKSLTLTEDLIELGIPMIICLNAIDETSQKGIWFDSNALSNILQVPVIELIAIQGVGINDLKNSLPHAKLGVKNIDYGEIIEEGIQTIESKLPNNLKYKNKISSLVVFNDPFIFDCLKNINREIDVKSILADSEKIRSQFKGNLNYILKNKINKFSDEIADKIIKIQKVKKLDFINKFAALSRHPVYGIPILAFFLFITYILVVYVAGYLNNLLGLFFVDPIVNFINLKITNSFLKDFLIGNYGLLTVGIFNAICTVLPILSMFFIMFAFLEDIGYIPNLCVLTKRIFDKIGLSGKSILPIVLGFGCKTMATLVAKTIPSKKERLIAVFLIAFALPCAVQMAILISIIGKNGFKAFIITFGALFLVEIFAGFFLDKILKEEEKNFYIQELPKIRLPNVKAIFIKTYYRLYWFLKEALPIFIVAALVFFVLEQTNVLNHIKIILKPLIVSFLGLPLDFVDVMILMFARREAAAAMLIKMVEAGTFNYIQCIVAVFLSTIFIPCFANIVAICKEIGLKEGIIIALSINVISILLTGGFNLILVYFIGGSV